MGVSLVQLAILTKFSEFISSSMAIHALNMIGFRLPKSQLAHTDI